MLKNKVLSFFSCIFIITFLFFSFFNVVIAKDKDINENKNIVRVGWYNWKITGGDSFNNDSSKYMREYYNELEEKTGLKFEYVACELKDSLNLLEKKKIDLVFGMSYNTKLAKKFKFIEPAATKGIIALIKNTSFDKEENFQEASKKNKNNDYNYLELKTKKIGVLDNGAGKTTKYYKKLLSAKTKINSDDFNIKVFESIKSMKEALKKGDVDYIIGLLYLTKSENFEKVLLLSEPKFYLLTNYDNKILIEKLSEGLKKINAVGNKYNKKLSDKYFPKYKDLIYLTQAEQMSLDKHDKLYFYYRKGMDSYYKKNADGSESGYYAGFAKNLADLLGKDYEMIPMEYEKRFDYTKPGLHCDLLYNYKFAKKIFHSNLLSKPTMNDSLLVCARKNFKVKPSIVYASASKSMSKSFLKSEDKAVFTKNDFESLQLLIDGKIDVAIVNGMISKYVNGLVRYKNIKIIKIKSNINHSLVGVHGVDADFISAINKAILKISKSKRFEYMSKVINSYEYKPTIIESIRDYYNLFILFIVLIALVAIIFIRILFKRNLKIKKLAENVKQSNESKNKFIARMSHNMRTPLNAIINYAKFGIEENKTSNSKNYFKKIEISSQGLLEFMKGVLDLENINLHVKNDEHSIVEVNSWQKEVSFLVKSLAKKKGVNFEFKMDYKPGIKYLKINERLVKQIFLNLLTNAIKYTKVGGSVSWAVKVINSEEGVQEIHEIVDNGVGMSEEFQKNMFKPFSIEDNSETNKEEGTGLGLAICERAVKELGGKIICKSKRGTGTTFVVELFHKEASKNEIEEYLNKNTFNSDEQSVNKIVKNKINITKANMLEFDSILDVLICEDVLVNIKILEKMLENEKINIDVALNGKMGVELVKEKQKKGLKQYDLIIMDIRMPIMDGVEATREIRKIDAKVIIIGLSANAYHSDFEKALNVGMNYYLAKPIDRAKFFETLLKLLPDKIFLKIRKEL